MRTTALFLTMLTLAATPASAQVTEILAFDGNADCNGWAMEATVHYRDGASMIRLEYAVVLSDADGVEVERSEFSDWLDFEAGQTATVSLAGSWTNTSATGWQVRGDFVIMDVITDNVDRSEASFTADIDCGTDPGGGEDPDAPLCARPPRWYRNNPDQWPADTLEIGGEMLDAEAIMRLLRRRAQGLLPVMLARQVIAAKFNLMNNPQADVAGVIDAADAWLADHSPFQSFNRRYLRSGAIRQQRPAVRQLVGPLLVFNFAGCTDAPADLATAAKVLMDLDKAPVAEEDVSFGALKAMYR